MELVSDVLGNVAFKHEIAVTDDKNNITDEKVTARCFTFSSTTLDNRSCNIGMLVLPQENADE